MNGAQACAYLAAMIDGEGHIRRFKNRSISVANTDWDLIEAVVECCRELELRHSVQGPRPIASGKQVWEVRIVGRESLETVAASVPIRSRRKQAELAEAIAAYRHYRRPPAEWLEQKYVFEGRSSREIADMCGVPNPHTVLAWLRRYGIPVRSGRGAATAKDTKEMSP